jgi:hypothetical protein
VTDPRINFPRVPDPRNDHHLARYIKFCQNLHNLNRKKSRGDYLERHRILPGCMGGLYEEGNVVLTTRREHCILHLMLHKAFPLNEKLGECASMMMGSKGSRFYSSLEFFQKCEQKSKRISESNRKRRVTWGPKISESLKGYEKSQEHCEKISQSMKEAWATRPQMKEACSRLGSKQTEETKRKIGETVSKQKWFWKNENGEIITTRSPTHPGEGWNPGRFPRR